MRSRLVRSRWAVVGCLLCLAAGSLSAPAAEPFRYPEGKHKGGELKYINDLPVLTVDGTPEELAEQAATLTAAATKPLLELPKEIIRHHHLGLAWPLFVAAA